MQYWFNQSTNKGVVSERLNYYKNNRFRLNGTGKYTVYPEGHKSV